MKILFLCNKSPWPPREGGPMAMNMFIEGLIASGHHVRVLAVNSYKYNIKPEDIPQDYRDKTGIGLVDVDLRIRPVAAFMNLFTGKSYHVERFISEKFRASLIEILSGDEYDVVQLETLFMCPYIPVIRDHSKAKIVLRAHNIEHLIWQRIAEETRNPARRWYLNHLAVTLRQYEREAVRKVDGIAAITSGDAAFFEKMAGKNDETLRIPVTGIPFGIDPGKYARADIPVEFPSVFSLGSMNWLPNLDGIRWFLSGVWPSVSRQYPGLKYYLAGRGMPGWMLSLKIPGVVVLGEVEDAGEFLASKAIMIVPLFSGSGIRVKIIEGMAAGKTIISTPIGAEGIRYTHMKDILIAGSPHDFIEAIATCVDDPALCENIGKQARLLAVTEYNAELLVRKLLAFYEQIPG